MARPGNLESTHDLTRKERDQALALVRDGQVATVYHRGQLLKLLTEADVHKCYPSLRKVPPQLQGERGQ